MLNSASAAVPRYRAEKWGAGEILDSQAELLPLRIDAAILLDQALRLKSVVAAKRKSAGPRILGRIENVVSALRGATKRPVPSRSRKQRENIERCAAVLLKSGLFDSDYYLRRNPDVAAAGVDPVVHYLQCGASELRNPGPYFSTRWYVQRYPDVAASGKNPLYHFIVYGYSERRLPRPPNPASFWATDPVSDLGIAQPAFGPVADQRTSEPTFAALGKCEGQAAAIGMTSILPVQSNARLVVYTALFGNYDDLFLPPRELALGCDFVVFTDQANIPPPWRRGHVAYAGPSNSTQNRFYKLMPHRLFPQYEWSLYLDANVDIRVNPIEFLERYCRLGPDFFVFRHPTRASIVEELAACIESRKGNGELMVRQVAQYLESDFRHIFPLTENNVLLRRHNDPDLADLSEAWWDEVRSKSGRDQLSLSYVVEKKDYGRIALFEDGRMTARHGPDFRVRPHRQPFYPPEPAR